jgi:hypothetical protein
MTSSVQTIDLNVRSLLEDVRFLKYVLDADEKQHRYWMDFEQRHPQWRQPIQKAKAILQQLDRPSGLLSDVELASLKKRIKTRLSV